MPEITVALLRKRAEHNEGVIATLEEISLHQEELESINELLGSTCRKLKILYLQNNIIPRMQNLHHLKDLGYLNLALNNISKIEGLQNCEFLHKLDLTMNFVDVDELEASMKHLQSRDKLRDMYMMGNPSQVNFPNFVNYVVAMLPQLESLDGTEITKSMRIVARQNLPQYEAELRVLAREKKAEKLAKLDALLSARAEEKGVYEAGADGFDLSEEPLDPSEEMTENTPESRQQIYRELAQQKKEKEDSAAANLPKVRNYEKEQKDKIDEVRRREEESGEREVKQKNEGNWDFTWDEDSKPGSVLLEVQFPKHLDSSLIDVDVHPNYVSMIVKSKLLRLKIPVEVQSSESSCQRSKVTGSLTVSMPKVNARETLAMVSKANQTSRKIDPNEKNKKSGQTRTTTTERPRKKMSLQEEMAAAAVAAGATGGACTERLEPTGKAPGAGTDFRNIIKKKPDKEDETPVTVFQDMSLASKDKSLVELIE